MGNQFTRLINENYYDNDNNNKYYYEKYKERKYNNINNYKINKKDDNKEKEVLPSSSSKNNKQDNDNNILIYINEEIFEGISITKCDREKKNSLSSECICYQVDLQQQCGKYIQAIVDQFVSFDVHLTDNRFCNKSTIPLTKKLFVFDTHCLVRGKDYVRMYPSILYWKQLEKVADPYPNTIEFELAISHRQIKKEALQNEKEKKNNVKRNYNINNDISATNVFQQNNKTNEKKETNNTKNNNKNIQRNEKNSSLKDTMKEITTKNNKEDIKIEGEVDRISFRIGPKTTHVDIPVNKLHLDHLFQQILIENKIHISVLHDGEVIHDMHSWKMEGLMLFICEDEKKQEQVNEVCELNPFSGLQ